MLLILEKTKSDQTLNMQVCMYLNVIHNWIDSAL